MFSLEDVNNILENIADSVQEVVEPEEYKQIHAEHIEGTE